MTQQGGHTAGACGTEDEGRVSHQRDSTRKQPPRQNASLPRYTQLSRLLSSSANSLQGAKRGGRSHTFGNHHQFSQQCVARGTAHLAKQRTPTQAHFSPSSNILLVLHLRKPQEGCLASLPKNERISRHREQLQLQARGKGVWGEKTNPKTKQCRKGMDIVVMKGISR